MKKLTINIEPDLLDPFKANCEMEGSNMSVEVRKFMRRYNRARKNERIRLNNNQKRKIKNSDK